MKKTILFIMILASMSVMLSAQSRGGMMQDPSEQLAMYDDSLDLNVDQEAAFLEILTGFNEKLMAMMDSGSRDRDKMMTLMVERDDELLSLLNEQQAEQFVLLSEEMMAGRGKAPRG